MVEQRSPKPSIWVRILVLLPNDFTKLDGIRKYQKRFKIRFLVFLALSSFFLYCMILMQRFKETRVLFGRPLVLQVTG